MRLRGVTEPVSTRRKGAYPNTVARFYGKKGPVGWGAMIKFPMRTPRQVRWIATYTDEFDMPHGTIERMAGRVYRMNSIFDPRLRNDASMEGQSGVFGLSVMNGMYDAYRVYFCKIEARFFKRDDLTAAITTADALRDWSHGFVMHLEMGTSADTTTDSREWVTDSIQRKSRSDGTTGDAVEGLYEPPEAVMPLQIRSLVENGATFPGWSIPW